MYILKNAWLSITRNKGRNILMGIIIIVIAAACAVTLAIRNSADKLISSYEDQYEVIASISMDRSAMRQGFDPTSGGDISDMRDIFDSIESLTVDDISSYADSSYVTSYYYTNSLGLNGSNIDPATSSTSSTNSNQGPGGMGGNSSKSSTDFTLTGYSSLKAMTDFIEGNYTITSGEVNTDSTSGYNCVINEELATLNEIEVGDTIKLVDPNDEDKVYKLVVTGIFSDNEDSTTPSMNMFTNSVNNIITSSSVVNAISSDDEDLKLTVTPSFVLKDASSVDAFNDEVHDKGLSEYMTVTSNLNEVESSTQSVSNVKTYATTFLIITLIIGSIVLLIINMINVRERKYEIGVLRTIGMKKSTLAFQFIIELLIVSSFALMVGSAIGASMSVSTANNLLASEISNTQSQKENIAQNFGGGNRSGNDNSSTNGNNIRFDQVNGVANVSAFTSIDAVVDIKVLLELLGIGLALTLLSSLASMINIQRFSPLTILKERG